MRFSSPTCTNDHTEGFPDLIHRQSAASYLGGLAQRVGAKFLMLTHLIPLVGADRQGPFKVPGGADGDRLQEGGPRRRLYWNGCRRE